MQEKAEAYGSPGLELSCSKCNSMTAGTVAKKEKLYDGVKMVKGFCYFADRFNASGGSKAAVMTRTRIGWVNLGM